MESGARPQIDLDSALARFGHSGFRPGQRETIDALLAHGRVLLVAPTGGGKSLTYQLPGSVLPGTTIVVSPLIALMNDQVRALETLGVPATYLASTIDQQESNRRIAAMRRGEYKLVYVAPERLALPWFQRLLPELDCPLLVVDEAHCISEWGHDFRPEYMALGDVVPLLGAARVLACTATATPLVRDEILVRLGLGADTPQIIRGFARPNLHLRVREVAGKSERTRGVDELLREALGAPGGGRGTAIVYSPTRKESERESERLAGKGWRTEAYHAGLPRDERSRVQDAFIAGDLEIVVATNAFGMGIDRSDVRAVVHLAPPGSVEAYYQEVGRGGRDGEPAFGLLLLGSDDPPRRRRLIEMGGDGQPVAAETVEHKWGLYLELLRWAQGGSCRHDTILRYFGDGGETLDGCGVCDICENLIVADDRDEEERTEIVRKALSGVARVSGRFGIKAAISLLRGARDERLQRTGLDEVTTFGILKEHSEEWLMRLLLRCVTAGWVGFEGEDRPVVALLDPGREVMLARRPARVLLPPELPSLGGKRSSGRRRAAPSDAADALPPEAEPLFEALRAWRQAVAREEGVPAYVIAHDRTLRDLAALRPTDPSHLDAAWGFGPAKQARYGDGVLAVVRGMEHGGAME